MRWKQGCRGQRHPLAAVCIFQASRNGPELTGRSHLTASQSWNSGAPCRATLDEPYLSTYACLQAHKLRLDMFPCMPTEHGSRNKHIHCTIVVMSSWLAQSLVEAEAMQFCRLCPLMCCACEIASPRVHTTSMPSVPESATSQYESPWTCDASHPGKIDTWWFLPLLTQHVGAGGSYHFSSSMQGWILIFFPWGRSFCFCLFVTACMLWLEHSPQTDQDGIGPDSGENTRAAMALYTCHHASLATKDAGLRGHQNQPDCETTMPR